MVRPAPEQFTDAPLLQWLEVFRDVHRIPDATPDQTVTRLTTELRRWPAAHRRRLTVLALSQAPPRARALLGALLDNLSNRAGAAQLRASLNPLTTYRLSLSAAALPNRTAWHIR